MDGKTKTLLIAGAAVGAGVSVFYATKSRKYSGFKLKKSIVIDKPANELYDWWHDLENLPQITDLLKSVETLDITRSRWTANAPGEIPITWEADIIKDI